MQNQNIFILLLILILIFIASNFFSCRINIKKNLDGFGNYNENEQNSGVYNYFFMKVVNPYPFPMLKFFTNDIQKPLNSN